MFSFIRSLFFSDDIPATKVYEKALFEQESNYALYLEIQESDHFRRYLELKEYVGSQNYNNELAQIKALSFNNSHEALSLKRLKELGKLKVVKNYLKSGDNAQDDQVKEFIKLQHETSEAKFVDRVKYLKNTKRHKQSDPFLCKLEYEGLCKSEEIKQFNFFKKKYTDNFESQAKWVSKLYDDFAKGSTRNSRWLTKQFWGDQLLNGTSYAAENELHIAQDENVSVHNGVLRIDTKREEAQGLSWSKTMGLIPKQFTYTSGIANTANSFRQLYGRFEAKIRCDKGVGVQHAFWMAADINLPHINIMKFDGKNLSVTAYAGNETTNQQEGKTLSYKLDADFYIYSFIWTEKKMVWKINGKVVFECPNFIFEPMYLAFSSGVNTAHPEQQFPLSMEVDWVRCFRSK